MPHSWHFPTAPMLNAIAAVQPQSILDIGCGYGKWGFLCREMLDWNPGRLAPEDWITRIDGVEVFDYQSPLLDWVYDSVRRDDVMDIGDSLTGYDLVIMSDVIEHLPKEGAVELLHRMLRTNRNILISTPLDFFEQEIAENPNEHHISHWTPHDFEPFVHDLDIASGAALVVLLAGRGAQFPREIDRQINLNINRIRVLNRRGQIRSAVKRLAASAAVVRGKRQPHHQAGAAEIDSSPAPPL